MLHPSQFHDYQREGYHHQMLHPDSMMWLGMGLGKTVITLTTINDRMRAGVVDKTLVFGPLRVVESVWQKEARKWSHTQHLRFSLMTGNPQKRLRALFTDADIYMTNYENMNWLAQHLMHYYIDQGKPLPFQFVVYDEVSKLKNSTSVRMMGGPRERTDGRGEKYEVNLVGWRKLVNYFKFRTGLTGTPASNGYIDLHGQYLAVDGGKALGEYITHYRNAYFTTDHMGYRYTPSITGKQWIEHHINPITLKMDARDHLDLPERITSNVMVKLPAKARRHYDEVEKNLFTEMDSGRVIELFSKATASNKLLQICNGQPYVNVYDESEGFDALHSAKLDALEEIIDEAGGSPVLCSYSFLPDAERIMKRFKKLKPVNLSKEKSSATGGIIKRWNEGKIRLMLGHPASMGHGIDELQESGSIVVWFGINWSLELYEQLCCRLDRQGQTKPVQVIRILCEGTVDLVVADAIARKDDDQEGLKKSIERYRAGLIDPNEVGVGAEDPMISFLDSPVSMEEESRALSFF